MSKAKPNLASVPTPAPEPVLLKLDIGCGKTPAPGFVGVDKIDFGQTVRGDMAKTPWILNQNHKDDVPWFDGEHVSADMDGTFKLLDNSVDEVRSSHFVEHLTGAERVRFFNELWRVMKPGATALIVTPNWSHACAYGDPTHQWPPMSPWYPLYLNKAWRESQSPHVGYECDFDHIVAGSWDPSIDTRNQEYKQVAMNQWINCWRDLIVTFTKRAP